MDAIQSKEAWKSYRTRELAAAAPILESLGFALDHEQPHTAGVRDVGLGGLKLVLLGTRTTDNTRAVIKVSSDPEGKREMEHERLVRERLGELTFAQRSFKMPRSEEHT